MGGAAARNLARVGDSRLMGVERDEVPTRVGRAGGGKSSLSRKVSRACEPHAIKRMWSGPCGDGANCTTQFVVSVV